MKRLRRAFLLLEAVVGLALLALLAVLLLKLQGASVRQFHAARERAETVADVQRLLWTWSSTQTPVTLPATGEFDATRRWERRVEPIRIAAGVFATQVSLIVMRDSAPPREIYRVDWFVTPPPREGAP